MRRSTLLIAVLAITLGACSAGVSDSGGTSIAEDGSSTTTGNGSQDSVELRLLFPEGGGRLEGFQAAVDMFEAEHEGVSVSLEAIPFGEYEEVVLTQWAGDSPADLVLVEDHAVASFASNGVLAPLDGVYSDEDIDDFLDTVVERITYDGTVYAGPMFESTFALFYDVDLMDAAGVVPPQSLDEGWTWDEWVAAMQDVVDYHSSEGSDIWGTVFLQHPPNQVGYTFNFIRSATDVDSKGYLGIAPDLSTVSGYLDAPEVMTAYQKWQDLFQADGLAPTSDVPDAFGTGGAATMVAFSGWGAVLDAVFPDLNWGVAPLPYITNPLVHSGHFAVGISAGSSNQDVAKEFLAFLTSAEGFEAYSEMGTDLPARESLLTSMDRFQEGGYKLFADELVEWAVSRPGGVAFPIYNQLVGQMMADIALGGDIDQTVQSAIEEMDAQLAQIER